MSHYIITNHAKERMKDRVGIGRKQDIRKEFQLAMKYGSIDKIKDEDFKEYLEERGMGGNGVKVYDGNIFIHRNKTLITIYPVPDKFKYRF